MTDEPDPLARSLPTARVTKKPGPSWAWLVPLIALGVSGWIGWHAHQERGPLIAVRAKEGHGIGAGDVVRYRGIDVGEIEEAQLEDDLATVVLRVRLSKQAGALASTGTKFWVVRPHLSLDEVTGLETVFGARYLEAVPGPGPYEPQTEFVALEEPPVLIDDEEGSLDLVLIAATRYGLQPGAPVTYRQVEIGRVLSVALTSDASSIEVGARIRPQYARIVRTNTRFWEQSGVDLQVGLFGGMKVGLESLRALVVGSIALATPDEPGETVENGQRFVLADEPDEKWLTWKPSLPIGHALLPAGAPTPHPLASTLTWTTENLFLTREERRSAWVLPIDGGLLGPADVLAPQGLDAKVGPDLFVAGERVSPGTARWEEAGLVLLEGDGTLGIPWPSEWVRTPTEIEDVLAVADPGSAPLPLATSRFSLVEGVWNLDRTMRLSEDWHGAPAFSRRDGRLVGVLLIEKNRPRLVPVPGL